MAALFPDMFCSFYFVKIRKFALKTQQPLKLQKETAHGWNFFEVD
jgi:hypothetical protein